MPINGVFIELRSGKPTNESKWHEQRNILCSRMFSFSDEEDNGKINLNNAG